MTSPHQLDLLDTFDSQIFRVSAIETSLLLLMFSLTSIDVSASFLLTFWSLFGGHINCHVLFILGYGRLIDLLF